MKFKQKLVDYIPNKFTSLQELVGKGDYRSALGELHVFTDFAGTFIEGEEAHRAFLLLEILLGSHLARLAGLTRQKYPEDRLEEIEGEVVSIIEQYLGKLEPEINGEHYDKAILLIAEMVQRLEGVEG